jgi:hypothetical protein
MQTTFTAFLHARSQDNIVENEAEIIASIENRDTKLLERIENHRENKMTAEERAINTVDSILESIRTNPLIRSFFRKDITRQTLHEKAQIEWLRLHKYHDIVKMSANIGGLCLSNNAFHTITSTSPRSSDATKSFDISSSSNKVYGILKHTSVAGGAQDNQYRDVKHFIREAVGYLVKNGAAEEKFEFYLDGEYYTTRKRAELNGMIPENLKTRIIITSCESIRPE